MVSNTRKLTQFLRYIAIMSKMQDERFPNYRVVVGVRLDQTWR